VGSAVRSRASHDLRSANAWREQSQAENAKGEDAPGDFFSHIGPVCSLSITAQDEFGRGYFDRTRVEREHHG